jgi:hypothetical protein
MAQEVKYEPNMCATIIACGEQGESVVSRCVALGIDKTTYYRWIDPNGKWYHEDFAQAHAVAELKCQHWWESIGRKHITFEDRGTRLDAQNYRLQMMNRFGWSEKGQQDITANGDIVVNLTKRPDANGNS